MTDVVFFLMNYNVTGWASGHVEITNLSDHHLAIRQMLRDHQITDFTEKFKVKTLSIK